MLRAIWFLVKVSIVVAAAVWVAEQDGTITIDWEPYKITVHVGFFILLLFALLFLSNLLFFVIKGTLDFPEKLRRYRDITGREKGYRALTIGLTSVAAGDSKAAKYQAHRANRFLKDEDGLVKLLQAQTARMDGDEQKACEVFAGLLENKDAAFLGIRGLMQNALNSGDYEGALELGRKGMDMYPKQAWILKIVYRLEIRNRNWDAARKALFRLERIGDIPTNKANSDRVAMYIAEAEAAESVGDEKGNYRALHKAYKCDKRFVPAVLRLGELFLKRGNKSAAIGMIEEAWKLTPHPGLVDLWTRAAPPFKAGDSTARIRWYERLLNLKPESVEGKLAMAEVLIQEEIWGEARKVLNEIEAIRPNVRLYKLRARLEEKTGGDQSKVREWLEKAADSPRGKVWICSKTGCTYDRWVPVSDQGYFNTIVWDYPQNRHYDAASTLVSNMEAEPLLEAPMR